jgi:transcriptional regulator with XRE-family HTH domain
MPRAALTPVGRHVGARVRMRRMMLSMSQTKLRDVLSLTFQQVQKYEKGTNRISASRLQPPAHLSHFAVAGIVLLRGRADATGGPDRQPHRH